MQIKTINYERVLNLGNYENKKMALFAELTEGDDVEESISRVMETVERKIREEAHQQAAEELRQIKQKLSQVKLEYESYKSQTIQQTIQPPVTSVQDTGPENNPF
ncbi:hypothetical protein I8752_29115 [Nostocaceae cyanobacterium CENA369]|uniref:Uncharacterized protein n=1 Tax=Dendronalium phyllosphericum CENA369 TaxID=1725256 RepID=A0A8J7IHS8_9NOST|nr:hypothetical protein [Dendronalium phyllosphericum]MBH8576972.1 hypothetical protein [Dendronalium phyllosphericum CENA369]